MIEILKIIFLSKEQPRCIPSNVFISKLFFFFFCDIIFCMVNYYIILFPGEAIDGAHDIKTWQD